ncbi:MAG: FmdB family transcriptional regulator [Gemmatimonadetes bacterium]|nr:FmdB family transcriptional regulator [Gemmatimonadota bacterium]
MPTYEFRCPDGTIIERVFKISEVPESIPLPSGDGVAVRVISGGAGLIFKGSGFYITDYGKDGKKDQRSATSGEAKGGETKGGASGGSASATSGSTASGGSASASSGTSTSGSSTSGSSSGGSSGGTPAAS